LALGIAEEEEDGSGEEEGASKGFVCYGDKITLRSDSRRPIPGRYCGAGPTPGSSRSEP